MEYVDSIEAIDRKTPRRAMQAIAEEIRIHGEESKKKSIRDRYIGQNLEGRTTTAALSALNISPL